MIKKTRILFSLLLVLSLVGTVFAAPLAARFTWSANFLTVSFMNESTAASNPIEAFEWDFGDGQTSEEVSPSHTYTVPGRYIVTLTIESLDGTNSKSTRISVEEAEFAADFSWSANSLQVNFANESIAAGNSITAFRWNFGDGNLIDTEENPSHTYTAPGQYTVTLTIISAGEIASKSASKSAKIRVDTHGLVADFAWNANSLQVDFANESIAAGNTIEALSWTFGDGNLIDTEENPSYTYTAPGQYTVTLTMFTSGGTVSKSTNIRVNTHDLVADFSWSANSLKVDFMNESTTAGNSIEALRWNFGDGNLIDTEENPSHTYTAPGQYTVTLTMTTPVGTDSKSVRVRVSD